MAVDLKALKSHPGRNPDFEAGMKARRDAQAHNKAAEKFNYLQASIGSRQRMQFVQVPKQPNKYVPHQGAKEQARGLK